MDTAQWDNMLATSKTPISFLDNLGLITKAVTRISGAAK